MQTIKIFDLDQTVIDSSHRTDHAHVNGKFALDIYLKECNQPEQIARDSLLPLAAYMQALAAKGEQFAIITARFLNAHDLAFIINNKLVNTNSIILGRDSVDSRIRALPDSSYKVHQLNRLKAQFSDSTRYVMFEDMQPVLARLAQEQRITMINAVHVNQELEYIRAIGGEPSTAEIIESHVSSKDFQSFCIDNMLA